MSEPVSEPCRVCREERKLNQFRRRPGGVRQRVCRRCTVLVRRRTASCRQVGT